MVPLPSLYVEQEGLKLTLTTDKAEYTEGEQILVNLKAENISESLMSNVALKIHAPEGFGIAEGAAEKTIASLNAGAFENLEVTYEAPTSPETGDSTPIVMAVVVMFICATAVMLLCINRRTRCMALALIMVVGIALPVSAASEAYNTTVSTTVKVNNEDVTLTATATWEVEIAEQPEPVADNLAAKFETEQDLGNVRLYWTDPHALSIDTTVVHGEDKGSLKVTALVDGQGSNYIILTTPLNNGDFSEYDYISFWVYNPTEKEFAMGTAWAADTVCKPGEWTEVRITKAMFEAGSVTPDEGDALTMGNIAELRIRLMDAENLVTGDYFFISSVTAGKNA